VEATRQLLIKRDQAEPPAFTARTAAHKLASRQEAALQHIMSLDAQGGMRLPHFNQARPATAVAYRVAGGNTCHRPAKAFSDTGSEMDVQRYESLPLDWQPLVQHWQWGIHTAGGDLKAGYIDLEVGLGVGTAQETWHPSRQLVLSKPNLSWDSIIGLPSLHNFGASVQLQPAALGPRLFWYQPQQLQAHADSAAPIAHPCVLPLLPAGSASLTKGSAGST
jgi:hypothetical protein